MSELRVGLVGNGSANWMAGLLYNKSLLQANALLPPGERLNVQLFLHECHDRAADYADVRHLVTGADWFDYHFGQRYAALRKPLQALQTAWRERRWPRRVRDNLPQLLQERGCQVLFPANGLLAPRRLSTRTISWITDFQHRHYPHFFLPRECARRNRAFRKALRLSDRVIVSNESSRRDAEALAPEHAHKLRVVPFTMWLPSAIMPPSGRSDRAPVGNGDAAHTSPAEVVRRYALPEKFLMFPSQFWVHKNHRRLFLAIDRLVAGGLHDMVLVCTGNTHDYRRPRHFDELESLVRQRGLERHIRILGLLPRDDQVQLMRAAAALVQPSLFEGWSALVEEAQSLGKTIFLSDIPMHREQPHEQGIFFNPLDEADLADKLAATWLRLVPGPQAELEAAALVRYRQRLADFGRRFREVCQSVC